MKSLHKVLILCGLAVAFCLGIWLQDIAQKPTPEMSASIKGLLWPPAPLQQDFTLHDHHEEVFSRSSLLGRWSLMFFGFTHCPDVCPATIAILDSVHKRLLDKGFEANELQVVLVSVDPERDDSKQLREYLAYFNEEFIGVTGSHEQLRNLSGEIGALYVADEPDEEGQYSVDHTAAIFLFDPQGRRIGVFSAPHEITTIVDSLIAIRKKFETS